MSDSVLIIDDDEISVLIAKKMLEPLESVGKIESLTGGMQAVEYLKKKPAPDFILLDLDMPEVDGTQVLEFIGDKELTSKVVIYTTNVAVRHDEKVMQHKNVIGILNKPMVKSELLELLQAS